MFCWTSGVENVMVLSKLEEAKHIDIHVDMSELDVTKAEAENNATYEKIKAYVQEHFGFKVSTLNIAQVVNGKLYLSHLGKKGNEYLSHPTKPL